MRAAQINRYGGKEAVQNVTDAVKPQPGADQVLVEVRAAAVNPFDLKVREGLIQGAPLTIPGTLGGDVAGVVAGLGEGVSGFQLGQAVFGQANAMSGEGSFAEFTPVKTNSLAAKPASLDFVNAAALPLTSVSAYQALVEHANLQAGQKVLIHGGAGGIGSIAIQLAKYLGAQVATTASAADAAYVKDLGAYEVIDYTSQDFVTMSRDYDVVYDTVGGETLTKSLQVLKPGGVLVSMMSVEGIADLAKQRGVTAIGQVTKVTTAKLTRIAQLVDEGLLTVHVDKVFPLDQAAAALEHQKTGHPKGKVVLLV